MPRVGFFQSVLRQPTRSYANPHNPSPWALDDDDDDNASFSSRGYQHSDTGRRDRGKGEYQYASGSTWRYNRDDQHQDQGNGYDYNQAGPSRQNGRYRPPPQAFANLRDEEPYDNRSEQMETVRSRTMSESGARRPRKAKSSVGFAPAPVEEEYPAQLPLSEERLVTRFPRAAPKARSVVGIQDTGRNVSVVERNMEGQASGRGTVKRKKKRPVGQDGQGAMTEAAQLAADSRARTVSAASAFSVTTIKSTRPKSTISSGPSGPSKQAVPAAPAATSCFSQAAAPAQVTPVRAAPLAPAIPPPPRPTELLVTRPSIARQAAHPPPSASSSSAQSSRDRVPQTPPDAIAPPVQVMPDTEANTVNLSEEIRPKSSALQRNSSMRTARSRMSVASNDTGATAYWTPPTSPGSDKGLGTDSDEDEEPGAGGEEKVEQDTEERANEQGEVGIVEDDPETPAADDLGPPRLMIQPPTPAPLPDTSESVFNTPVLPSPSPTPAPRPVAEPAAAATGVPARALSISRPKLHNTGSAPPALTQADDDVQSLHAHTGSDDEVPTAPTPPDAEPISAHQLSRPPARPPSITHSAPLPVPQDRPSRSSLTSTANGSRHSRQSSRAGSAAGSAGRRGSYQAPEAPSSLASGPNRALRPSPSRSREGSIRSSTSYGPGGSVAGFGKGGWAAAAASGSQSGRNSPSPQPIMYMPTGTMDGWEQFHVPPPPRQTRYTPLPAASQPATFERLLNGGTGTDSRGGSVRSGGTSPRDSPGIVPTPPSGSESAPASATASREQLATAAPVSGNRLEVPSEVQTGPSESSASQYSEEEGSSSEDEDAERPSRSYMVVTNPSRLPAPAPEVDIAARRSSGDMAAPPIPAKSPRRFSQDVPEHAVPALPLLAPSLAPATPATVIQSPPASESQYSYGSESALDASPPSATNDTLPTPAQAPSIASDGEAVDDRDQIRSVGSYSDNGDGEQYSEYGPGEEEEYEGEDPDDMPSRPLSPSGSTRFPRPSFLDPDVLTVLPEMSVEDSNNLYRSPAPSEAGLGRRQTWRGQSGSAATSPVNGNGNGNGGGYNPYEDSSRPGSRAASRAGSIRRSASAIGDGLYETQETADRKADSVKADKVEKRPISILMRGGKQGSSIGGSEAGDGAPIRKAKSSVGFGLGVGRKEDKKSVHWEGSSIGEGVLMQSDGKEPERLGGYTSLVLPAGAYTPSDPNRKRSSMLDHRILGMPSTSMAALTLSSSASKLHLTPVHLRHNLPAPVDFSSHLAPPNKVGSAQVLVQVYAVGVDKLDMKALEGKGNGEIGKWVPGRSFVGRVVSTGKDEREVVKGELVLGLLDVKRSGALAEYILIDRRRVTRAPHPTSLTLEQLSLLPLHGIPTVRAIRSLCLAPRMAGTRALIQDAHHGIPALLCQELSRRGVHVTAIIPGGENAHEAQTKCMAHGARGVLTGSPAAVLFGLEEGGWEYVVDTVGGERVYEACQRVLREGGTLISLVKATPKLPLSAQAASKPSGFRTLRAAFAPKATRRNSKHIHFEYVPPAGDGEPEVDARGMDVRDVLEDDLMAMLKPAWEGDRVWNFERGMEAFKGEKGAGVSVVRLIN